MDEVVKRRIAAGLFALAVVDVQAQGLQDPTRPASAPQQPSTLGGVGGMAAGTLPQLQSVLIGGGAGGRRVAVISGQAMVAGDKLGDAVLLSISENQVVLKSGKKLNVLKLFPVPETRRISAAPGSDIEK